jgi:hypothetical protein
MRFHCSLPTLHCHLFGDSAAPGHTITVDIFSYASFAGKITLALSAPEFFAEPLRKAMRSVDGMIGFVHIIPKCVPTTHHERQHARYPQIAVFDFANLQSDGHHACCIGAACQSLEQCPAHKSGCGIEQFLINWKGISQMMKHDMGTMKIALLHMTIIRNTLAFVQQE